MPKVVSRILGHVCLVSSRLRPSLCNLTLVCVEFESTYLCTFIFDSPINVHGC